MENVSQKTVIQGIKNKLDYILFIKDNQLFLKGNTITNITNFELGYHYFLWSGEKIIQMFNENWIDLVNPDSIYYCVSLTINNENEESFQIIQVFDEEENAKYFQAIFDGIFKSIYKRKNKTIHFKGGKLNA